MFLKKTVLVLGAGASNPYGFQTGGELVREILFNGEPDFREVYIAAYLGYPTFLKRQSIPTPLHLNQ